MDTAPGTQADLDAFAHDLTRGDDLSAVLRAHIRIENHLIRLIEKRAAPTQPLERLQLEYDQYVTLAFVMGLRADWVKPLRAVGRLRNTFAHKLDATLDVGTVNDLYECLPPDGKAQVHDSYKSIRSDNPSVPLPERFGEAGPKERFQIIALIIWTRLTAWLLQAEAKHGA
jgi:hypothetical protein